jgi:hypothetical protein
VERYRGVRRDLKIAFEEAFLTDKKETGKPETGKSRQ